MNYILLNTEMTKAVLDGRKTQTRRIVKGGFLDEDEALVIVHLFKAKRYKEAKERFGFEAPMKIGQTIWVREPAKVFGYKIQQDRNNIELKYHYSNGDIGKLKDIPERFIEAGDPSTLPKWIKNCQGIPNGCIKEMARIFLKITDIRVERLQDITYEDIFREGFDGEIKDYFITTSYKNKAITAKTPRELKLLNWWINLWNKTAPKGYKWEDNSPVFVNEFKRVNKDGIRWLEK